MPKYQIRTEASVVSRDDHLAVGEGHQAAAERACEDAEHELRQFLGRQICEHIDQDPDMEIEVTAEITWTDERYEDGP